MSKGKVIENPEVPGFERILPPPPIILSSEIPVDPLVLTAPPPPPPPLPSPSPAAIDPSVITSPPPPPAPVPAPVPVPGPGPGPGVMQPLMNSYYANPIPPQSVPWWIPTEADTQDSYPWYADQGPRAAFLQPEKPKPKVQKRKHDVIDPVQDAEKVAAAQRELTTLMKPLKCDLCNAVMNSTLQAKLHYDGKPHQKKVSMYLNQSVKRIKSDTGTVNTVTNNDWDSYCDVCKTWFTSQTDAAQHYAGKKHIRATTGASKHKTHKKNSNQVPVDPTGRFGIGTGFHGNNSVPVAPAIVPPVAPPVAPPVIPVAAPIVQVAPVPPVPAVSEIGVGSPGVAGLEGFAPGAASYVQEPTTIDYSIYRTPSGSYYCAPCNKSFTSENSFGQHVESKKHKNQVNIKTQSNQTTTGNKKDKKKKNK
ncbi:zinc finger homeobox protein 2-like isoform X2 [Microplitis mediator]|uniref:zinc finger homeobox protein 2-like isoform X2 n=1 Tax=Microplitis mediator TaxID=375433 RepID=UPI002553F5F0|nr:zinc finger homeobox protein 2-like isoform X2 [Microplitis mediator]